MDLVATRSLSQVLSVIFVHLPIPVDENCLLLLNKYFPGGWPFLLGTRNQDDEQDINTTRQEEDEEWY